jgi:transcriptional regulator with XRE-family HTH domain
MTSQEFGTYLRERREEKRVTLSDITAFTRINPNFLDAIERGDFTVLPQTYVRAFLREYAASVDLDPEQVMKMYDETLGKKPAAPQRVHTPAAEQTQKAPSPSDDPLTPLVRALRPYVFGAIIIIVVGGLYFLLQNGATPVHMTQGEIPFDRVIRETEAALPADTHRTFVPSPRVTSVPAAHHDSLTLEMATTDSLWLAIRIDNSRSEEFLFAPNRRRVWRAESTFVLTMGNAGGATFRLNGMELGALGRPGAVLRNRVISSSLLQ